MPRVNAAKQTVINEVYVFFFNKTSLYSDILLININFIYSVDKRFGYLLIKLELSENLTITPLQCLACSKRPECLRMLSGNVILKSIKDQNSLTDMRKMTANNPNVDLVSIKFGQNLSICPQDIDGKPIFEVNQGP